MKADKKTALICMLQVHKNSGSARTAFENIRYFLSRGFEVHIAAMTMDKISLKSMNVIPHKMLPWLKSTGITRRRWYNWQVQKLRKKIQPSITVGHGDIDQQDVLTLHNCVFYASELIHEKPLSIDHEMAKVHGQILKNQSFKKMIANSNLMKIDTIKRFKVPAEKIHVVYPAVDTKIFFPPSPQEKITQRKRFGFSNKIVISLITSGNFKKRGVDIFVKAIAGLSAPELEKIEIRIIGKDEPGPFRDLIEQKNLSHVIKFQPSLNDIENFYHAIDIFVLPARIEEFGRVVLEAMSCGLPVITTKNVGAGELLKAASSEFVIPSHDPQSLIMALKKLITNSKLREELSELNASLAKSESEELVYEKFDKVFLAIN